MPSSVCSGRGRSSLGLARVLPLCVLPLFVVAQPAAADFIFSGSATGGTVDFDSDGNPDGTWTMQVNPVVGNGVDPASETVFFPAAGGAGFRYNGTAPWSLDNTFNVVLTDPEVTFQLTLFGNIGEASTDFGSRFNDYSLSWTGGSGAATVNDPAGQLTNIVNGAASVDFNQVRLITNSNLQWSVAIPQGASNLNILATNGAALEGFRFSVESFADISVEKTVSDAVLSEGDSGSYTVTVENVGTGTDSAAVGTMITDVLPAGVTFVSASISSDGANTGGSYDSVNGIWNVGKVSLDETITLTVNFTVDAGTSGDTITNTIDPADIELSNTDPTNNHGALSASFTVADIAIDAVDDTLGPVDPTAGGATASVLANDTLNGASVAPADVDLTPGTAPSPAAGAITMDPASGVITVAAGTTPGVYSYPYTICEAGSLNCDSATATVTVNATPSFPGLLDTIRDEVREILEDDLAQTISTQSREFGRLSDSALDRLMAENRGRCSDRLGDILAANDINFATDSAVIVPQSEPILDALASVLGQCPSARFEIGGHTDARASEAYNLDLSQRRVDAVRVALEARGVAPGRLVGTGYGESQPIADNTTAAGLAANRRVEFTLLEDVAVDRTGHCGTVDAFDVDGRFRASGTTVNSAGTFGEDHINCATFDRTLTRGSFSLNYDDDLGLQGMLNATFARETQSGDDRITGRFLGFYLSQTDVDTSTAEGTITGIGINGGVYTARAHDNGTFTDMYAAASIGRHAFDLDFAATTTGEGSYIYGGLFAGAALSGMIERSAYDLRPRAGIDLGYGVANDADVTAEQGGATDTGTVAIDPVFGARLFAENAFFFERDGGLDSATYESLELSPRVVCSLSMDGDDG
ncbi:MAG: OmpA family protein, partial [Pseudomonadota bacterium]